MNLMTRLPKVAAAKNMGRVQQSLPPRRRLGCFLLYLVGIAYIESGMVLGAFAQSNPRTAAEVTCEAQLKGLEDFAERLELQNKNLELQNKNIAEELAICRRPGDQNVALLKSLSTVLEDRLRRLENALNAVDRK